MRKKWFYVDITTTWHECVAIRAEDEEEAKDIAGTLIDAGKIDESTAIKSAYGSANDSITIAEREFKRPPKAMRKFEQAYATRPLEEVI
jgi:hypothetical protein